SFIVLNINVSHIIHSVFSREFAELQEMNSIAVTDEGGRTLYGRIHRGPLAFEAPFPTTLYKWRLTIAPKQMGALSKDVRARSVTDLVFVLGAVAVIFLGMLVLMRAIRKERRANALKSEFIANVSHELKTTLSLIRMFGELLAAGRTRDASTADEYAAIIARESDRLTGLIDNVLDFARIERGKAAYAMVEGDLSVTVERAIDLCRYRVEQAGVTLDTAISPVMRAIFDESAVTLLLLNLIENALKYGAKPGEHVLVSLDLEGGAACLRVVDEGSGIAVEERKRIFERFYRGASSRTSAQRGSGIGLALVKHIAEAHGGGVKVESKLGKGAVFAVSIPVVVDPA
ncbi:MAG: HAMP domain-containing histidine kinase, partial [Deltaproteobacteria bacterium]|nr:HAMP domain-containing histidine kinase [Deltaproteobacteria bacterium]